jgi:hypothetical protein
LSPPATKVYLTERLTVKGLDENALKSLVGPPESIGKFINILKNHNQETSFVIGYCTFDTNSVALLQKIKEQMDELHYYSFVNEYARSSLVAGGENLSRQSFSDFVARFISVETDTTPQLQNVKTAVLYKMLRETPSTWAYSLWNVPKASLSNFSKSTTATRKRKL